MTNSNKEKIEYYEKFGDLIGINIPRRYWEAKIDNKSAIDWIENHKSGDGLFIHGPVGRGKTYLACAIGIILKKNDKNVLFETADEMIFKIRLNYKDNYNIDIDNGSLPITNKITREILSLPLHPEISAGDIGVVVDTIISFLGG